RFFVQSALWPLKAEQFQQIRKVYLKKSGKFKENFDQLLEFSSQGDSTIVEDCRDIKNQKLDATTKDTLVSARIGQGAFRSKILQLWDYQCAVTRSATLDAIRASHIKPWRESTNAERLDPQNGLPLIASLDALFDVGLISFESSGKLITSSSLSIAE